MKSKNTFVTLLSIYTLLFSCPAVFCSKAFPASAIKYRSALYQKKGLGTTPTLNYAEACATHNNFFKYFINNKQYDIAKEHLDKALAYARKSKSSPAIHRTLINAIYYDIVVAKNYEKARTDYKELFSLKLDDSITSETSDMYYGYADVLEHLGDYREANKYLKKGSAITGIDYNQNQAILLKKLEPKYDLDKIENSYIKTQEMLEEDKIRDKKIAYVFLTLLLLSIVLFYFFYQNTVLKQKNRLKDIHTQNQNKIINATIDGQETERKKIAAVLHDSISAQLSSAGLHLSAFSATHPESEEIIKTRAILKDTHDSIRALSHELIPALLSKLGLFFALRDLCEKNSNRTINFNYSSTVSKKTRYKEEYEMKVYFIIKELFNNIIKHSEAKEVDFDIKESDQQLIVYIRDNGKGFDTNSIKINEGFGLTQIRARVASMIGKFIITSSPNKGTAIKIILPIQEYRSGI